MDIETEHKNIANTIYNYSLIELQRYFIVLQAYTENLENRNSSLEELVERLESGESFF